MSAVEAACLGTLTKAADHRIGQSGKAFTLLDIAVGDGRGQQFLSAIVFRGSAMAVANLDKADRVYIEGKIEISEWTDRDGNTKHGLKITSFYARVPAIGRHREPRPKAKQHQSWASPASPAPNDFHDDDLPM